MDKHACGVYQKMISEANIPNPRAWSSKINCQQFARELVLSLNLVWPIDVPMASGDAVPAMFDKDMLLYSIPKVSTIHPPLSPLVFLLPPLSSITFHFLLTNLSLLYVVSHPHSERN